MKKIKKGLWLILFALLVPAFGSLAYADDPAGPTPSPALVPDALQEMFLRIGADSTPDEVDALVSEFGLFSTAVKNSTISGGKRIKYQIAFTQGSASQRHADPGDRVTVSFLLSGDEALLESVQYANAHAADCTAVFYVRGTFWDFHDGMEGDLSGYYTMEPLSREDGVRVVYKNGHETVTKMFPCADGEAALAAVMERVAENG